MANVQIAVTKAGKEAYVEIDTDKIPQEIYEAALLEGLKSFVNKKMTKVTKKDIPSEEMRLAEAMKIANDNVEAILAGTFSTGRKSTKVKGASGAVKTEAMRIAKAMVKDEMKRAGIKISHVEAKEITRVASELIEADPSILETAKANIEARNASAPPKLAELAKTITISAKKKAKADAEKEAKKTATLSAKQAGMVQTRAKPNAPTARH